MTNIGALPTIGGSDKKISSSLSFVDFYVEMGCTMRNLSWLLLLLLQTVEGHPGVLLLDHWTFNKTIDAFPFSVIKFDRKVSSVGAKIDAYYHLAQTLAKHRDIVFGDVYISDMKSPD